MIITISGNSASYYVTEISDNGLKYEISVASIFQLELLNKTTNTSEYIDSSAFTKSSCKVYPDNKLKISYYGSNRPGILKVHITGVSGENKEADLGIDVVCKIPGYALKSVKFPVMNVKVLGSSNNEQVLAVPMTKIGGAYYRKPSEGTSNKGFNYPGNLGMQYISLYNYKDGHNLFMQQLDSEAHLKDFYFAGSSPATKTELAWIHFPINGDEQYKSYYHRYKTRIATLTSGDWYDASVKYRQWATGQFWAQHRGKLLQDPSGKHSSAAKKNRFTFLQSPPTYDKAGFTTVKNMMDSFVDTFNILFQTVLKKDEIVSIWYDWHRERDLIPIGKEELEFPHPDWTRLSGLSDGLLEVMGQAQQQGYKIVPYTMTCFQFPYREQKWYNANSYDLNYINVYEAGKLQSVSSQLASNNRIFLEFTTNYNVIDPQRKEWNDSIYDLHSRMFLTGGFDGMYCDVYPSEAPVNYNPFAPEKGGSPRQHLGYVDNHLRIRSFVTGTLNKDYVQLGEYGNEISLMDQDLPNHYRAELTTGDVTVNNNTGIITAPLLTTVYHEYSRFGTFDYMETPKDVARIYHEGAIPGILLIEGTPAIVGNIIPSALTSFVDYLNTGAKVLGMMASFVKSSGATDKYLIYGEKLRPISGSREYLMTRYDAPPTGNNLDFSAWRSQDDKIGVVISSTEFIDSHRINLTSGQYLRSGTPYDLYVASGSWLLGWNDFVYSGRYTGHYDDVVNMETTYMIKVLEFRP